jgi:hypothetical protein
MSILNSDYGVLFIHIPKTGGTSMRTAPFIGGKGGHRGIKYYQEFLEEESSGLPNLNNVYKFCFVRNPWDRLVSLFSHHYKSREHFTQFILHLEDLGLNPELTYHYMPQCFYMTDSNDEFVMDFVGRYEHLERDWNTVCSEVGVEHKLPHKRKGFPRDGDYKRYYTKETWDVVRELYKEDLERLGYNDTIS